MAPTPAEAPIMAVRILEAPRKVATTEDGERAAAIPDRMVPMAGAARVGGRDTAMLGAMWGMRSPKRQPRQPKPARLLRSRLDSAILARP